MPKLRAILAFLLLLAGPVFQISAAEEEDKWTIESESGLNFNFEEGTIPYTNAVTVRYGGATLTAERAQLNQKSGDILAEGNVRIEWEGKVWYGQRAEFNFKTR